MTLVATQVKRRRGTTAENDAFTGAEGEIVVDIERHELRVHDGVTQGGFVIPTTRTMNFASKSLDNLSATGEARFTNKANSDLSNIPSNIDYVVESQAPTAQNNYTWYRKYKSGWVEQGGMLSYSHTAGTTTNWEATFAVPMADTNFTASSAHRCPFSLEMTSSPENIGITRIQGFLQGNHTQTVYIYWVVYGMSAQ